MELMVTFGLINSIVHEYPPHVKEGLIQRMEMFNELTHRETVVVQGFGEAFDESAGE